MPEFDKAQVRYGYAQENVIARMRVRVAALRQRILVSGCAGACLSIGLLFGLGPDHWGETVLMKCVFAILPLPARTSKQMAYRANLDTHWNAFVPWLYASAAVFICLSSAAFVLLTRYFSRRQAEVKDGSFIRGMQLLTANELKREIQAVIAESDYLRPSPMDLVLGVEKIIIPDLFTYKHIGLFGDSGSGKSIAIDDILMQSRQQQRKAFIIDPNGELFAKHGRPGDKILSLYDSRAVKWDFFHEDVNPRFIAAAFIEIRSSTSDPFWSGAGQGLLEALIRTNSNIGAIWRDLLSPPERIKQKLIMAEEMAGVSMGEGKTAASVLAVATKELYWLPELNSHCAGDAPFFSLYEWVNSKTTEWVFVVARDDDWEATMPLIRTWFEIVTLAVFGRNPRHENIPVDMVVDEVESVGHLPMVSKVLGRARKYKGRFILGAQNIPQLTEIYGDNIAKSMLAGLQNKMIYRCSEVSLALEMTKILGAPEVEVIESGSSLPQSGRDQRDNISRRRMSRSNVLPDQLALMPDLTCYLKMSGLPPARICIPYRELPYINELSERRTKEARIRRKLLSEGMGPSLEDVTGRERQPPPSLAGFLELRSDNAASAAPAPNPYEREYLENDEQNV